jgi:hypothetical protein
MTHASLSPSRSSTSFDRSVNSPLVQLHTFQLIVRIVGTNVQTQVLRATAIS